MRKYLSIICLLYFLLSLPQDSYGQKNIGEFNRTESPIFNRINELFPQAGDAHAMSIKDKLNEFISNAQNLITEIETRISKCKHALQTLPETPKNQVKSTIDNRTTTEQYIKDYEHLLGILKRARPAAQERMSDINARKQKKEQENKKPTSTGINSGDDFWSANGNNSSSGTVSNKNDNHKPVNEDDVPENTFKGNISHIKEGQYFVDDQGQHYLKTSRGARKVDKLDYERAQAQKITAKFEQEKTERLQVEAAAKHAINTTFTSFYAMRMAGQNLKDATLLEGHFENLEDLNQAFAQKLREVSRMGDELKAVAVNNAQNYAQAVTAANSTGTADYTAYGKALGALGGIAAGISADKAAKEAREELKAQREAHEKAIKARELKALTDLREEIGNMFPEGGMPLSNHKINVPVLYLFAYSSNKTEWNQDKVVPLTISNVIPVYQYSDGTYPYISNVKRTFENGGISEPTIIGYFTDQAMAERYQESLLNAANQGRFLISEVEIKVIKKDTKTPGSSETDFWGNPIKVEAKDKKETTEKKKTDDFWNN